MQKSTKNKIKNKEDLLSLLALVQNSHLSEKETENKIEKGNEPEYKDKINIFEVLNTNSNVNTDSNMNMKMNTEMLLTNSNSKVKIVDNYSPESENSENSENRKEGVQNENDQNDQNDEIVNFADELYTFGHKQRASFNDHNEFKYFDKVESINLNEDYDNTSNKLNESLKNLNSFQNSYKNSNSNRNSNQNSNQNSPKNTKVMSIFKIISEFKHNLTENILLINTFSDNLATDINMNPNLDFISVHEKCINSIIKIKSNINDIFISVEDELNILVNKSENLLRNSNQFDKEKYDRPMQLNNKFRSSISELTKVQFTNTNNISHDYSPQKFAQLSNTDAFDKPTNIKKLYKEVFHSETNNPKKFDFTKTKDLIESITNHYKNLIKEKNEENKKLKENLKYYEELIVSSKNLIDDIYSKNKLLKEKLIKYKFIVENKLNIK